MALLQSYVCLLGTCLAGPNAGFRPSSLHHDLLSEPWSWAKWVVVQPDYASLKWVFEPLPGRLPVQGPFVRRNSEVHLIYKDSAIGTGLLPVEGRPHAD